MFAVENALRKRFVFEAKRSCDNEGVSFAVNLASLFIERTLPVLPDLHGVSNTVPVNPNRRMHWMRVAVTLAVLAAFAFTLDMSATEIRLSNVDVLVLAFGLILLVSSIAIAAVRWVVLARLHAVPMPYRSALEWMFASHFLGQVLPSTLGVDAVRSWLAIRTGLPALPVIGSVIVDRLCGVSGLLLLVVIGAPTFAGKLLGGMNSEPVVKLALVSGVAVAIAASLIAMAARQRVASAVRWAQKVARSFAEAALSTRGAAAILLSVLIQTLVIGSLLCICRSLGLTLSLWDGLTTLPLAMLLAVLPISINGWGIREGAIVATTSVVGLSPADALLVSLCYGIILFLACTPGAVCWLSATGRPRKTGVRRIAQIGSNVSTSSPSGQDSGVNSR